MALHAQEGYCHFQHVIVHRTMWTMTVGAVLCIFSMFVEERAFLISMALGTYFLNSCLSEQIFIGSPVRFMTVCAEDLLFMHGVVARQGKFRLDFLVAALAHILHVPPPYRQIRPHVDIVAIKAGHIRNGMRSGIPVVKIKIY